jgi:hypothetical protein
VSELLPSNQFFKHCSHLVSRFLCDRLHSPSCLGRTSRQAPRVGDSSKWCRLVSVARLCVPICSFPCSCLMFFWQGRWSAVAPPSITGSIACCCSSHFEGQPAGPHHRRASEWVWEPPLQRLTAGVRTGVTVGSWAGPTGGGDKAYCACVGGRRPCTHKWGRCCGILWNTLPQVSDSFSLSLDPYPFA